MSKEIKKKTYIYIAPHRKGLRYGTIHHTVSPANNTIPAFTFVSIHQTGPG